MDSRQRLLAFFDPELAAIPGSVELFQLLLTGGERSEPLHLDAESEAAFIEWANQHRLTPQLLAAIDRGAIGVSSQFTETAEGWSRELAISRLSLDRLLIVIAETLSSHGVEFIVLKGVPTGRLDYSTPTLRVISDVDILVRREHLETTVEALSGAGFARTGDLVLLDKGESLYSDLGAIDVHTRPHAAGGFLGEWWWDNVEEFVVAGQPFQALPRGGRLGHACSHLAVSYPNHRPITSLLDIVTISRSASDQDRAVANEFLAEIGVSDLTSRVMERAAVLLDDPGLAFGSPRAGLRHWALRRAYDRPDLDLRAVKLAKTIGMPWSEKPEAVRRLIAPSPEFLALGGYSSRRNRLRSLLRRKKRGV